MRLRGCFNFRDLGGYETDCGRTRYQRLFRSDGLHLLTAADQDEVARLGVATVIDLRTSEEVAAKGRALVRAARYQLPMDDLLFAPSGVGPWHAEPAFLADMYLAALAANVETLREILAVLTDPSTYPAVISCSSGIERTGIVTAVVLGMLGVPDSRIVADFAGSREAVLRRIGRLRFEYPAAVSHELDRYGAGLLGVVPEAMTLFLQRLREEHGSFPGYAGSIDMAGAVPYLRAALLET